MSLPRTVPSTADVTVSVTGLLRHRCPFVDEVDLGDIDLTWRCDEQTIELHSLREWLRQWESSEVSHEDITDTIAHVLSGLDGIEDVRVVSRWFTAGMTVAVTGGAHAVLRQPQHAKGA